MKKYTRRLGAPIVFVAVALLGACSSGEKKGPDGSALGADTTLNKDLALASRDSVSKPQLQDVPANAPAAPAPVKRVRGKYRYFLVLKSPSSAKLHRVIEAGLKYLAEKKALPACTIDVDVDPQSMV